MKTMTYIRTCKSLILLDLLLLTQIKTHVDWKSDGNDEIDDMIARNLIHKIRKSKGPVYVEVTNFHDAFWVQAVKSDLISMLAKFEADAETGFEIDEQGHFSKDYQV